MNYFVRLIPILFLSFTIVFGQSDDNNSIIDTNFKKKNNLQFELLGKGFYYTLGYERNILISNNIKLNTNLGLSIFPGFTSLEKTNEVLIPMEVNASITKSNNEFLFGLGTTFWKYYVNSIDISNTNLNQQPLNAELVSQIEWFAHLSFEYRLHSKSRPIFYKFGYVPLFFDLTPNTKFSRALNYQTSFTIGIGWSF